jgi:hypothetical protein
MDSLTEARKLPVPRSIWWLSLASVAIVVILAPGIWRYDLDAPFRSHVVWRIWLICLPLSLFSVAGLAQSLYCLQLPRAAKIVLSLLHLAAILLVLAPIVAFILVASALPE